MSDSTPDPTGIVADGPRGRELRLTRTFRAPMEDVWASVTESARLERWIGRWEGDPSSGRVRFYATAEGEDVQPEDVDIVECVPPRILVVDTAQGDQRWHLRVELSHDDGVTTLRFTHAPADDAASTGPGWEYYLDRLGACLAGLDVAAVVWDEYFPAMQGHYAAALAELS